MRVRVVKEEHNSTATALTDKFSTYQGALLLSVLTDTLYGALREGVRGRVAITGVCDDDASKSTGSIILALTRSTISGLTVSVYGSGWARVLLRRLTYASSVTGTCNGAIKFASCVFLFLKRNNKNSGRTYSDIS